MLLMKGITVSSSFANGQAGFSEVILGKFQDVLQFFISFFKKIDPRVDILHDLTTNLLDRNDHQGDCELLAPRVVDRYEHLRCPMRPMSGTRRMSRLSMECFG